MAYDQVTTNELSEKQPYIIIIIIIIIISLVGNLPVDDLHRELLVVSPLSSPLTHSMLNLFPAFCLSNLPLNVESSLVGLTRQKIS